MRPGCQVPPTVPPAGALEVKLIVWDLVPMTTANDCWICGAAA